MQNNIQFLTELSNILSNKISPVSTIAVVNKLYKSFLNIEKVDYIVWDNNSMLLRDFVEDWKIYEDDSKYREINYAFNNLATVNGTKFYFNDNEYSTEMTLEVLQDISQNVEKENRLIFPLMANGDVFGIAKFTIDKQFLSQDLFAVLKISFRLLSGAFINYLLNEQMEISLNFYKAMKDIAKIIESQYELSYIIPLIGEMIDRFISSHLIYIFICQDNAYKLVWPSACKDNNIYSLLDKINVKSEYVISENQKIGVFPIRSEENAVLGAIVAYSNIDKLLQKDIDYLVQLTRQSGMTIHRANVYAEVLKYATLDALTGLNNRRQMEVRLKQEVSNAKRNNSSLCCMMIDVDYFKKVNDTYGHAAGDCVLKNVSEIIKNEIREYDIACRYGGEEFYIILPQTNLKEASLVAHRLRKIIEDSKINVKDANIAGVKFLKITVSIGVCEYTEKMSVEEFAQCADKALYEAKESGRNRVIVV